MDASTSESRTRDYTQLSWDEQLADDCRQLIRLAIREDLDCGFDVTTMALIDADRQGRARVIAREPGVLCGIRLAEVLLDEMDIQADWTAHRQDGDRVPQGDCVAEISGSCRDLLVAERPMLNFLGRLSGIATLAHAYVQRVAGTRARIYDTRKTTPGWRRLEKYAVRCGGARNHRTGLFDGILIKDNHLAAIADELNLPVRHASVAAEAVRRARRRIQDMFAGVESTRVPLLEVEVETLEQLDAVLEIEPDLVLLDNMPPAMLRQAVQHRDALNASVQLESSGGVTLDTIQDIARTGIDRISVGALTHSARCLDVALDWQ